MAYKPTIGLEVHAELNTKSKMFCSCKNDPNEKRPNFNVCPICAGHPGTLPVANEEAIRKVIKTGLVLNCKFIAGDSPLRPNSAKASLGEQGCAGQAKFDRKNYFYPDLPKGYQISQYDMPFCEKGYLEIPSEKSQITNYKSQTNSKSENPKSKKIGITRIHLEEDTGSLLHPDGADYSLVNLNRAGVPLMELVTEPDINSGIEASKFAEELQLIFRYLGVSDADMEKGLMRVEVNISLSKSQIPNPKSQTNSKSEIQNPKLGTKVEIKNLNSFRVVQKAIDFEIERQRELLEAGEKVVQETRGWDDKKEITFSQREKEDAHDYRYFPEPDLPPLNFELEYIQKIKSEIMELPQQKRERFAKEFGLDEKQIEVFVGNKNFSEYFEKVSSELDAWLETSRNDAETNAEQRGKNVYKLAANYLISDVLGVLNGKVFNETDFRVTPENFGEFIKMIHMNEISSKVAKMVLVEMVNTGGDPSTIVDDNNWRQMEDSGQLEKVIAQVLEKNPKAVEDYKKGNKNVLQFLAGQIMGATRGTANPATVQEILRKLL